MKEERNDDNIIICRCEEVTKGEIIAAIEDGATDLRGIRIRTRAGMGLCQGKSCEKQVRAILAKHLGVDQETIEPYNVRMPVRALEVGLFTEDTNE